MLIRNVPAHRLTRTNLSYTRQKMYDPSVTLRKATYDVIGV